MHDPSPYHILRKDDLGVFVERLAQLQPLAAPVARGYGRFAFAPVRRAEEVALEHLPTLLPPKKYFLPPQETLLTYDVRRRTGVEAIGDNAPLTILGVHTCDIAGIQCLNMVFSERPRDYNYLLRKRRITVIGVECPAPCDAYATCALVGTHLHGGGSDLFLTDLGDRFAVHVGTQAGDDIVDAAAAFSPAGPADLEELGRYREAKRARFPGASPVETGQLPALFEDALASPVWERLGERCLACGNCTTVCPTCSCFDVYDELRINLAAGRRTRHWDSCQSEPFALVAGGENFRRARADRQRHRFFRKFSYAPARYGRVFCTGCGRCSRACPAGIRLPETLAALAGCRA